MSINMYIHMHIRKLFNNYQKKISVQQEKSIIQLLQISLYLAIVGKNGIQRN